MKYKDVSVTLLCALITLLSACSKKHSDGLNSSAKIEKSFAGPPVYIYKTRADYSKYVPVVLSSDKKTLISYPAPTDVYINGVLAYPTELADGYLLDNRGINQHSAFLSLTYEQYSKLLKTPTIEELKAKILESDPFTELYYCGTRYQYKDLVSELNQLLKAKDFSKFRKVK